MNGDATAGPSRRRLLVDAGGILATVGTGFSARSAEVTRKSSADTEIFWGRHQGGIVTPAQSHTYFAAFDLTTTKRDDVASLLRLWTGATARLAQGRPIEPTRLNWLQRGLL
jgi:deferrochelatase/peroxidase EfeB